MCTAVLILLTLGQAVSFPVANILPIVTSTLGTSVHPHVLTGRNHATLRGISIAVGTVFTPGAALSFLIHWVHTWWGGAISYQAAGDPIHVTGALLTLRGLEVLPEFIHLSSVFTADLLAAWAAVGGVMADVHAGGWQSSALGPGTGWALWGALTLGAVI